MQNIHIVFFLNQVAKYIPDNNIIIILYKFFIYIYFLHILVYCVFCQYKIIII